MIFFNGNSTRQSIVQNGNFSTITVNGKTIQCRGSNVSIINNKVIVDGKEIEDMSGISGNIKVVINGDCNNVSCSGAVEVSGNVKGDIDCGGSCEVKGEVGGDIDCGGSCTCGNVGGDINAGGSVRCKR